MQNSFVFLLVGLMLSGCSAEWQYKYRLDNSVIQPGESNTRISELSECMNKLGGNHLQMRQDEGKISHEERASIEALIGTYETCVIPAKEALLSENDGVVTAENLSPTDAEYWFKIQSLESNLADLKSFLNSEISHKALTRRFHIAEHEILPRRLALYNLLKEQSMLADVIIETEEKARKATAKAESYDPLLEKLKIYDEDIQALEKKQEELENDNHYLQMKNNRIEGEINRARGVYGN